MVWKTSNIMDLRLALIKDYASGLYSQTELSERHGICRSTVIKWIVRFEEEGSKGLEDRVSRPKSCPHQTDPSIEQLIVATRKDHPHWGAKKLLQYLVPRNKTLVFPAKSTVNDILDRHNLLVKQPKRRRASTVAARAGSVPDEANARWCIDFKGQFRLGDRRYCYPLTLSDHHSRYLLLCKGLARIDGADVKRQLLRVFRECGLPDRILSDNGPPFVGIGQWGLSRLNVWWIKYDILHERSRPGRPQDNGRHERMHRTLKQETARPPQKTMTRQQNRFDEFQLEFNGERPHDAHDGMTPSSLWQPSNRLLPSSIPTPQYDGHYQVRRVTANGVIKFKREWRFLSETLEGESVGLEEIDDGLWNIWFYQRLLGRLDERTGAIY